MGKPTAKVIDTICSLDGMRIETADGLFLGHLFDLRCSWSPGASAPALEEIIYSMRGLLERIGLRQAKPRSLPWSAVQSIQGRVIVVRATGAAAIPKRVR
jgi:sporulation protein YlmC with PRC-barrel domain